MKFSTPLVRKFGLLLSLIDIPNIRSNLLDMNTSTLSSRYALCQPCSSIIGGGPLLSEVFVRRTSPSTLCRKVKAVDCFLQAF